MDIKVQTFKEKINTTNDKFFSALDDFKKGRKEKRRAIEC